MEPDRIRVGSRKVEPEGTVVVLPDTVEADLLWWSEHVGKRPARKLWDTKDGALDIWAADLIKSAWRLPLFCYVVTTDAAGAGWGATFAGATTLGGGVVRGAVCK